MTESISLPSKDKLLTSCRGRRIKQDGEESGSDEELTPRTRNKYTPLMRAADAGDVQMIEELLQSHRELVGTKNKPGKTALILAAERGHCHCARALLPEAGISTPSGATALMVAVRNRNCDIIRLLAPTAEGLASGLTPLILAVIQAETPVPELSRYVDYLGKSDRCGMTALMYAALFSKPAYISAILRLGAENNCSELFMINTKQETALIIATESNSPDCVSLLLQEGGHLTRTKRCALSLATTLGEKTCAEILLSSDRERSVSGITKLMVMIKYESSLPDSAVELLSDAGKQAIDGTTALMYAATTNRLAWVEALKDTEKGLQDKLGLSALMYAAQKGHIDAVRVLSACEAGLLSRSGETALSIAIKHNHIEVVSILLPYEAMITTNYCSNYIMYLLQQSPQEPNIGLFNLLVNYYIANSNKQPFVPLRKPVEGFWGETALIYAASTGDINLIKRNLTQIGQMHRGNIALLKAVEANKPECIPLLLRELGMQVWDGQTALMRASELGRVDCAKLLLAESYATTASGMTALMKAAISNKPDAVRLLVHEAHMQDSNGYTALMHAARRNNHEIVALLAEHECNIVDKEQKPALVHAILSRALESIEILLMYEGKTMNISKLMVSLSLGHSVIVEDYRPEFGKFDAHGNTALIYALMSNNYEGMDAILQYEGGFQYSSGSFALLLAAKLQDERGIEILCRSAKELALMDSNGDTALTYAIRNNHVISAKALAPHLFEATTSAGVLPIDIAIECNNMGVYALLYSLHLAKSVDFILSRKPLALRKIENPTELIKAVKRGDEEAVQNHLEKLGYMFQGKSSLFVAAEGNNTKLIRLLLCESRNANLIGETALIRAALSSRREAVAILAPLEQGISGFSEAMVHAAMNRLSDLQRVKSGGLDTHVTDALGNTALVYAAACGSLDCVDYLLHEEGKETGGLTPLMAAASNNMCDVVKVLLERTKYCGKQDILGFSALMHAVQNGAIEAAKLLLPHEASLRNEFSETVYDIANKVGIDLS